MFIIVLTRLHFIDHCCDCLKVIGCVVCLQWAVTASVDFSLAQLIQVIVLLSTGGKNGGGYEGSDYVVIAIHGGILFIHALLNSLPISVLSFVGQIAALWNLLGMFVFMSHCLNTSK